MVSQTAEYALRAVLCLAEQAGEPLTTRRVAAGTGVSAGYLSKVLHLLCRAGLVCSRRGLHGGYTFVRSADRVSILEVINAVSPLRRREPRLPGCRPGGQCCVAVEHLNAAMDSVEQYLGRVTVGDLLAKDQGVVGGPSPPAGSRRSHG